MRFIINCPEWRPNSAGVQVLFKLCHMMRKIGIDAYVTAQGNPDWDNPVLPIIGHRDMAGNVVAVEWKDKDLENDYIVYPDSIRGNPIGGKKIIRYMLYYPQAYYGGDRIARNELCIPFAPFLLPDCNRYCDYEIPESWIIELSVIDPEIFYKDAFWKEKNIQNAFWIGKGGANLEKFSFPNYSVAIGRDNSRQQLADILRRVKNLWCFDVNSTVPQEAYLCGANVFIITEGNRILQWYGRDAKENEYIYHDLDRIKEFVRIAQEFKYAL